MKTATVRLIAIAFIAAANVSALAQAKPKKEPAPPVVPAKKTPAAKNTQLPPAMAREMAGKIKSLRQELATFESLFGLEHKETLVSAFKLAELLRMTGDFPGAEPLYRRCLQAAAREEPPDERQLMILRGSLGVVLRQMGKLDEAEALHRLVWEASRKQFGAGSVLTVGEALSVAHILHLKGDRERAGEIVRDTAQAEQQLIIEGHPDTCLSAYGLAQIHRELGNHARALALAEFAYTGLLKKEGALAQATRISKELLNTLKKNGDAQEKK